MVLKSRLGINIVAFSFFMALASHAQTPEISIQSTDSEVQAPYEPAPLSMNQKFLLNFSRYHMGNNDKILASLVVLVPLVVLAAKVSPWFVTVPLVAPASSTMVNNYVGTEAQTLPDTMSHPDELAPLISYDKPQTRSIEKDTLSLGRSVGAFSAGAGTVTAIIWYLLGK